MKKYKIVFVVAHPDDESLWIGGLLNFLKKIEGVEPFVICMTGKNDPYRHSELKSAMEIVGIENWAVGNISIPKTGLIPLLNIQNIFEECLNELKLNREDINLLITHPFYGDEHEHLQHKQLFHHFNECGLPFAFFSNMTLPLEMISFMKDMKRQHNTHLINLVEVKNFMASHFVQFKIDGKIKQEMLSQYKSIDPSAHQQGYAAWDSNVEGIYFKDKATFLSFFPIIDQMEVPGGPRAFGGVVDGDVNKSI